MKAQDPAANKIAELRAAVEELAPVVESARVFAERFFEGAERPTVAASLATPFGIGFGVDRDDGGISIKGAGHGPPSFFFLTSIELAEIGGFFLAAAEAQARIEHGEMGASS
jgi:hypothetical protein